ncbi:cytochrome P450 [Fulvivirgaceae bacterium PWU5]|uniref:Cytochrome P450 n=1 Tax=Dawidia cretensis TaxID=2782350 RepID=A0AAP2GT56_9BACT|nr:cytochrome P450 [Dawidia cretensis]MBT1707878.1 cytochrome P450 [Dawidia cretensis]
MATTTHTTVLHPGYGFLRSLVRTYKSARKPIETMQESMARFQGTYAVNLGMMRVIATQDPGLIEHVLKNNHRNYQKSSIQTDYLGRFLGRGLLTANGDYWLKQRRLIQPGFHMDKIQALYGIMENTVNRFLHNFPAGTIDIYPLMHRLAFDMVIDTLFNVDVPAEKRTQLGSFISEVQEFVIKDVRQPYNRWWFRLSGEMSANLKKAEGARDVIRFLIRQRTATNTRHNDLLDMLLDARYEDNGEAMTESQVIDEILILLIAGHETTANALSWSLYLLAHNRAELLTLRNATAALTLNEVVMNPALSAVIKESMRLYPPAWISDRVALEDDVYNNYVIPKGTVIVSFYYGLHRDPKHWQAAQTFQPARFLGEGEKSTKKIFYPFGAGPRLCIGNNFAMAEMCIFLQAFLKQFDVHPGNTTPVIRPLVTLRPDRVELRIQNV